MGNLNNVFNPKNIALIGASDREGSVGRIALTNLLQAKDRKIFPVNPHKNSVLGRECFKDITSIGEPKSTVPSLQCRRRKYQASLRRAARQVSAVQ